VVKPNQAAMFQFLIGRLKTETDVSTIPTVKVFQFLIGRLKTKQWKERWIEEY